MPYNYPDKIPNPAKNWSAPRQRKCVAAANAVLNNGGSEEEAIFACIHSAKVKQEEDEYDRVTENASMDFQRLVELYFLKRITLDQFSASFKERLKDHYLEILLLGMQREPTEEDTQYINSKLDEQFDYLDGFVDDIGSGRLTQQRALWRAGLYAYPRSVYVAGTVPSEITQLMPALPGVDCLGGPLCGCSLQVEFDSDGAAYVYWVIDPLKENCIVCLAHASESPYIFTAEEITEVGG